MPKVATKVKARAKAKRKGTINDWKERYKTSALQPFGGAKLLSYLGFPMGRYLSFPCGAGGSKSYKDWSSMNFSDSLCYKLEKVDTHLPHSTLPLDSWLFWAIWIFWIPTLFLVIQEAIMISETLTAKYVHMARMILGDLGAETWISDASARTSDHKCYIYQCSWIISYLQQVWISTHNKC